MIGLEENTSKILPRKFDTFGLGVLFLILLITPILFPKSQGIQVKILDGIKLLVSSLEAAGIVDYFFILVGILSTFFLYVIGIIVFSTGEAFGSLVITRGDSHQTRVVRAMSASNDKVWSYYVDLQTQNQLFLGLLGVSGLMVGVHIGAFFLSLFSELGTFFSPSILIFSSLMSCMIAVTIHVNLASVDSILDKLET